MSQRAVVITLRKRSRCKRPNPARKAPAAFPIPKDEIRRTMIRHRANHHTTLYLRVSNPYAEQAFAPHGARAGPQLSGHQRVAPENRKRRRMDGTKKMRTLLLVSIAAEMLSLAPFCSLLLVKHSLACRTHSQPPIPTHWVSRWIRLREEWMGDGNEREKGDRKERE